MGSSLEVVPGLELGLRLRLLAVSNPQGQAGQSTNRFRGTVQHRLPKSRTPVWDQALLPSQAPGQGSVRKDLEKKERNSCIKTLVPSRVSLGGR